jgi:hypothetical protein
MQQTPPRAAAPAPRHARTPAATQTPEPAAAAAAAPDPAAAGAAAPRPPAGQVSACQPDATVLPLVPSPRPRGARRPLPDAVAVRRLAVPDTAPPYDDELQVSSQAGHVRPGGGAGDEDGADQRGGPVPAGADGQAPAEADQAAGAEAAARDEDQAAAARWPGQFAQVLAETLAGSRPQRQITRWTTEQARRNIRKLGPQLAGGQRPQVRRVVTSSPADDVVEMTAVVTFGPTVRALAVRLERNGAQDAGPGRHATPARWLCTAVEAA